MATAAVCKPCAGTVDSYKHHVFVTTPLPAAKWPSRMDEQGEQSVIASLMRAWKLPSIGSTYSRKDIRLSAIEGSPSLTDTSMENAASNVFLFPRNVMLKNIHQRDAPSLLQALCTDSTHSLQQYDSVPLTGLHLFVCVHGTRDKRCGEHGTAVKQWLDELTSELNLKSSREDQKRHIHVYGCSHIGGHEFAGNLVAYPSGNWFGALKTKETVENVLTYLLSLETTNRETAVRHNILPYWRGRMDLSKEEHSELVSQHSQSA
eukprot:GILJ01012418.1.p1 GENE.GILJ01012418.1~~GILJ01012418.1.p1  ORF type:complete len:284 (+),score=12.18 GILJ01012418.1:67-852(+)